MAAGLSDDVIIACVEGASAVAAEWAGAAGTREDSTLSVFTAILEKAIALAAEAKKLPPD